LTKAEKVNVCKSIAEAASVSVGTFTKARQVLNTGDPEALSALHGWEISIHRAWLWCRLPRHEQRENLRLHRRHKGLEKTVN